MISSFSQVSRCMIATNILRTTQFIAKLILWWLLFIYILSNLDSTKEKLMVSFSIFIFAWYQFWRFIQMLKRIRKYHLQWSFTIFDLTAICIVKSAFIQAIGTNGSNPKNLNKLNHITATVYIIYLIVPVTIFIVWINVYCRMREVTQKMGPGMLGDVAMQIGSQVSIQTLASQKRWFKVLVIVNVVIAFAIALLSAIDQIWYISIKLKVQQKIHWNYPNTLFLTSLAVDLSDIVLNFFEDRIIVYYAKKDTGMYLPEVPLTPFTCCDCGAFGYADFIALRQSEQEVNLY